MPTRPVLKSALLAAGVLAVSFALVPLAAANFGAPAPSPCSKFKKGTKQWKECMGQVKGDDQTSADEILAKGYWLAKTGDYAKALAVLRSHPDQGDAGVLTMIGFATRHLGRVDEALGYYERALVKAPLMTNTRQYLGEAYLQKRDLEHAKAELSRIAQICGNEACQDFRDLASKIAAYEIRG